MNKDNKTFKILMIIYLALFGFKTIVFADDVSCSGWPEVQKDIQNVFDFLKIIIPLLIIGLSSIDFIRAVTSKDAKDFKKAFNILLKRLALAVIFFFLPILINFLLDLVGTNSDICIE